MILKKMLRSSWFWLSLIVIASSVLRFWNITTEQHLTYDESRDYLILKRILVDKKLTLVGPTVSIAPGFFLPPFYYYSLLPFLKFSNFHIVGPDIYTAILGLVSVFVFYLLARDLFGVFPALAATFAYGINPYLVQTSRHAWNPNSLFLFSLLFFLAFERYLFKNKRVWFLLAGFSLGWAIGLHLTAIVFLPLFCYLVFLEVKRGFFQKNLLLGLSLFLFVFSPLVVFDLKHQFPITKASIAYLKTMGGNQNSGGFLPRVKETVIDVVKMPTVLLSGTFQKENMTIRPSNIMAFSRVNVLTGGKVAEKAIITTAFLLWVLAIVSLIGCKGGARTLLVLITFLGLAIRLCFPANLFYFYYYLSAFPAVFLVLAHVIANFKNAFLKIIISLTVVLLAISSWVFCGFYKDPKPEKYFLQASEMIAQDAQGGKVAIAGNVSDSSRWEHNGLEYRYFAEALYNLQAGNWEASDYKLADVLYFIDEGEVKDPLKFGGMEVEAFKPTKLVNVWHMETGQKIYKMTR